MSPLTTLTFFRALLKRSLARQHARREESLIPSFGPGGDRDRWYSQAACRHLEACGDVIVKRNRRGRILAMLFRQEHGGNPLRATLQPGQRYSFLDHAGDGRIWQHKGLETGRAEFQSVALNATTTLAKEETT